MPGLGRERTLGISMTILIPVTLFVTYFYVVSVTPLTLSHLLFKAFLGNEYSPLKDKLTQCRDVNEVTCSKVHCIKWKSWDLNLGLSDAKVQAPEPSLWAAWRLN